MTNWSIQMEEKKVELTANPKADALCLINDTAVEREREQLSVLRHSYVAPVISTIQDIISINPLMMRSCVYLHT